MKIDWSGGLNNFYKKRIVEAALRLTSKSCGVGYAEVTAQKRSASVSFARQLAMYLCHIVADMTLRDIAAEFSRDRSTVSHACHAIEDRRECPIFDRQIEHLEIAMRHKIGALVDGEMTRDAPEFKAVRMAV